MKALCVITPAALGPQYFRECAEVIDATAGGAPDRARLAEIMRRHGLTPAVMDTGPSLGAGNRLGSRFCKKHRARRRLESEAFGKVDRDLKGWNNPDDDHKRQGEHGSPQKRGNDSSVMRCQSPEYSAKRCRCIRNLTIVAFMRPRAQSGIAR